MKQYILFSSAYVLLSLLLCCDKMIEVDSPINQMTTDEVYQDTNTAYAALDYLYTELQTNSVLAGGSSGFGVLLGSYTDDLDIYTAPGTSDNVDVYLNQVLPTNSVVKATWTNAYKEIYMANAIIAGVDQSTVLNARDKAKIKGEAILIRSILYFNLTQIFGNIPYTTSTDYKVNQSLGKKTEAEILSLLKADTQIAIELLTDEYRQSERIFVNRKVGQILLANIFLLEKNWNGAEQLSKEIIQNSLYAFENDLNKVFKKGGKHILFQLKTLTAGTAVPETKVFYFTAVPPPVYAVSYNLINDFDMGDLRKNVWITSIGSGTGYFRNDKYKNITVNNDEYSVVYRLEQVYFILAEALIRQNKSAEAAGWINKTRQRAGISNLPTTLDPSMVMNELVLEKRREFFGEQGQRFFDLKRWDKLDILKFKKVNWKDSHQLWPLPVSEILLNANLNPQNEGY
ncbi:RagB/SusD family nutrient uptake outer membrane protein [Epilithonimonas zeae]|uniref:Starch-binding associating with outer membrane n=1 Tax=Epilithonimonas zeae TaxID=1416779 RepID=A0A1N6GPW3_9FLAO|nr:RagB/SusD family nutrient uptake outer membrane protein [Epilithonimonas zeae]SIO09581.1 Starch-binding associating with outer membrane [Epilithonimonas zeae]